MTNGLGNRSAWPTQTIIECLLFVNLGSNIFNFGNVDARSGLFREDPAIWNKLELLLARSEHYD